MFSDETANAAQLAFAVDHGNFSEIRGSIKDSLPDWMVDAAESIDSWMEGAEDAFEDILGVPGVRDALSALENQRGIVYNNVAEGPGTSLAVPPGVVGTSYLEDILASPNRPESLKEAIRALGQPEYGPYFPLEGRQFSHTPEVSGLRYGPVADLLGMGGDNLPVLARQQQLLDRQIAYETAAVRGPSSGQIPLPTQSVTLRDRLALDSGKESRASAEIVLAKDGLAAEYRRVAKQLRAKAELEARSVLPSSGKPIVPSSDRSKIKGIPREVSDWILKNSGPNDDFNADELIEAYHASRAYRKRIRKEADERYGDEVWELQALQRPPAKQRKVRPSGEVYWGRSGGEWDWFDSLSESHQRRLRKSMVPVGSVARGLSPDEASRFSTMAEVSGGNLHDASSDEAMGALIRKIDRADALLSVSRGRTDSEAPAHVNLDDLLPDSFDSSGISASLS